VTRRPGPGSLWRDRGFTVFLVAQTLSVAGDSFALIAVPLLVLRATGSVAQMGLLTGAAGAAAVVAGIFAGLLADRLDRWLLMTACDLARVVLYGLIPLAWAFHPEVWLLYVILPLCAALGMIFQVGYVTVVPALSGPARITEANGLLYAAASAAGIAGPLLAGLVSAVLGPAGAIAVDAGSFAVSAIGVLVVRHELASRRRERTNSRAPAGPVPAGCSATPSGTATPGASGAASPDGPVSAAPDAAGVWRELLAGARFLWQHPVLHSLTVLLTFFIFAAEGLPDVLIYYLKHGLGQGDGVVGLVLAIAALGTVAGALAVAPLRRRLGFGPCWTGAVVLCGLAIAGLGASGSVPAVAVLAALYLGCISVAGISSMSLRQEVTPDHLLGRVTAAFWTIHFSLGPAGAALLTWAAGHYGVMTACVASGVTCFLIGTAGLLTPVRRRASRSAAAAAET
jgi:MFS family permease